MTKSKEDISPPDLAFKEDPKNQRNNFIYQSLGSQDSK